MSNNKKERIFSPPNNNDLQLIKLLNKKIEQKRTPNTKFINPWSDAITSDERAHIHMDLLSKVYGGGHPGSLSTEESLKQKQTNNEMLTWIVTLNNEPVGMANCEILPNGVADLVRTGQIPKGTSLGNGTKYDNSVNNSGLMYSRIIDLISNQDIKKKFFTIEADLRMAKDIVLPSGEILPSGVRTQHINSIYELKPWLLCVPRYQVHPTEGVAHQEVFLQSRRYNNLEEVDTQLTLHTPTTHPGRTTIAEIGTTTYSYAWGVKPEVNNKNSKETINLHKLEHTAGIHFSRLYLSGDINTDQIEHLIKRGLEQSRFLEIIVLNHPGNINLQNRLMNLGAVAMGVMPGGEFKLNGKIEQIPTVFHYGIARSNIIKQMVDIELSKDHANSKIEHLSHRLRTEWDTLIK